MADNLAYVYEDEYWDEMLNGKIVLMSPRPSTNHNRVSFQLARIFADWLEGKTCEAFADGTDVYLTKTDRVVPDVMIVCDPDIVKKKGIVGAPDLIVEVLSRSTEKHDRGYKKDLYERCGVREYWIVDPEAFKVEAYLLEDGKYRLDEVYSVCPDDEEEDEELTPEEKAEYKTEVRVALYDDFTIPIETIFKNVF